MKNFRKPLHDLTGKCFDELTVISIAKERKGHGILWVCICNCGIECKFTTNQLRSGRKKNCGCKAKAFRAKPCISSHPLYKVLHGMKLRCTNPNHISYSIYGGNGINICDEWRNNPAAFISWGLANGYHKGLTIERIDVTKDYCPDNCTWSTRLEQTMNRCDATLAQKTALKVLGIRKVQRTTYEKLMLKKHSSSAENASFT